MLNAEAKDGALYISSLKTTLYGVPLPKFLGASIRYKEKALNDNFVFGIEITIPFIGKLISYQGELRFHDFD